MIAVISPKKAGVFTELDFIFRRFEHGLTLAEIAPLHQTSPSRLSRRLRAAQPGYVRQLRRFAPERRKAFAQYVQLRSLRKLSKATGISAPGLHWHFAAMHRDYAWLARQGVFAAAGDYLRSRAAQGSPERACEVTAWIVSNLPELLADEAASNRSSFTAAAGETLNKKETSQYSDFRDSL